MQSGSFDDLTVEQNLFQFTGDGNALVVGGGGSFERMHIVGNHFAGTTGGIFQNGGTINDAVVEQNEFTGGVGMNMGDAGNIQIRENLFDGNFYTGFQVGTIDGEIVGNTFQNIEAYPGFFGQAFELWGGQYGTTVSANVTIENNVIHYNDVAGAAEPTHGIRLRTPDGGSGIDASTIHINNNAFLDGGVRGDAKAIRHFGDQTTAVDASGNWWGTTSESSIAALMEDADGGTPLMVDFTSFLDNGTDTDGVTAGFQGDFSTLNVTALGGQTGPVGRIQEAVEKVTPGGTINIKSGTYAGNVDATATGVDKSVTLAPGNSPGQVIINGDFILNADDTLDIEVNGATAGSGFDQFVVSGTVDLGGAALNLIDGYDPVDGDVFTLIQNDGASSVTGTFAGLPEGFEFIDFLGSGLSAYLTYVGGDGDDVVIHMVDSTPEVDLPTNGTDDEYTIEIDGGSVVITEVGSGNIISSIPLASLNGPLVINGEDNQDDTLTIDMTGIDHTTPLQIEFNGGVGGFDTVELINGSLTSMEYFFVNNSDGSIQLNGSGIDFITYTGLEPISSTINATDVTLNYGGTSETITVTDAGGGQTTVNSSAGEITTFNNPTGTLTINAGGGDDIVNVNSLDPAFAANIIINGEGNDDTVNLAAALTLGSGNTTINAEDVNVNGAVTTTGAVDINAGDTIVFALAGSIAAGASSIDLDAVNNVELGQVATSGDVTVTSTAGAINDANVGAINITATNAILTAGIGAGAGDALETAVSNLEANIGAGLELENTGTLQIGGIGPVIGLTVGGASVITSTDTMTVAENISATGGALELENTGGNFILNPGVTISNNAANQIDIDSAGAVTMADGSQITHSSIGLIDIDAVTNIALSSIFTLLEVQLTTTTGSITDNTAAEGTLISAGSVALRAATGIGGTGAADIDLILNTLAANTTSGDVYLSEPSQTTVTTVNGLSGITAGGNIDLNIGGTLDINQKIEATGAASTINLAADGDINVTNNVITNGGAIDLLADNDLTLGASSLVDTTSSAAVTLTANADGLGGGDFTQNEGSLVDAHGGLIDVDASGNALIADLQSAGGLFRSDPRRGPSRIIRWLKHR
ncbi:hypothetical protein F1728_07805 [Gimesia benthica]|uniref:Right handed beta helix domain-containing protein n=1 Tax=Gimesia benthica TaxID=2608982 RepID=A0A6I6A8B0_9PLAN|nr:hypothetical protein [Gimesia benthica]QGQ22587.1 hypothetical protein F1728_07805 [Gimesia benthica]